MIAEEDVVYSFGERNLETRVCHNLGVYFDETEANMACAGHNAEYLGDDEDVEEVDEHYFVQPVQVKG